MIDLRGLARALGGEVSGAQVLAPGPGHRKRDRSLSVTFSATSPDGFLAFSHSGDDWRDCRDHVRDRLGLPRDGWKERPHRPAPRPRNDTASDWGPPNLDAPPKPETRVTNTPEAERDKARWLWRQHRPIVGSIAERYLRIARGYGAVIQPTLGFLPSRGDHPPALIAAFGVATEPEPRVLAIADDAVMAVQLVKLKPDGSGKADIEPTKIIIGKGALGSPIVIAPPNDLLGLAICEGVEDALSVHEATGLGAWASGGATRMPALADAVPSYIECITIIADDDDAGRRHAADLAVRLRARGFEAIIGEA